MVIFDIEVYTILINCFMVNIPKGQYFTFSVQVGPVFAYEEIDMHTYIFGSTKSWMSEY